MSFGKNLKRIRETLDMSASELAARSGLTPAAISQIENEAREPTLSTILKIMKVIPVKFEKLIEGHKQDEKHALEGAFKAGYDEGERAGFQKAVEALKLASQNRARTGKYWADWLESQMPEHPKEHTLTNQHGEEVKMRFE